MSLKTIAINYVMLGLILNASAAAFVGSGVAADWGVEPDVGGGEAVNATKDNATQGFEPSQGSGSTLFTLFGTAAGGGTQVLAIIFAFPTMIDNLGVPDFLVTFIFAPLQVIWWGAIVYLFAGRIL